MEYFTKVLFCVAMVLGNVRIWGDASIDSVAVHTHGYSNKKIADSRNCEKHCKLGQSPRRCLFDFTVRESFIKNRTVLSINDEVPGPQIQVCLNDIVLVKVHNKLQGGEFAIHWHGITQKGSPHMDGVPMITQCPITSQTVFTYAFKTDEVGTYFYHAHLVSQQLDGLYGSLVVKQPFPLEPASILYDHDRSGEDVFMVTVETARFRSTDPVRLLIDGSSDKEDEFRRTYVSGGARYRMRVINAIPLDCPVTFKIQNHLLLVISSDGRPVKPVPAESIMLHPGERMDFILNADQRPSIYNMQVKGYGLCEKFHQDAILIYENTNITISEQDYIEDITDFGIPVIGQLLRSSIPASDEITLSTVAEKVVHLKIDDNKFEAEDDDNEYRYLSDAMPVPRFYPVELTSNNMIRITQINGKSFIYPNAPILTQPEDILKRLTCSVGYEYKNKQVECLQVLDVEHRSTLELILVDEGFGSNSSKTFHLHGNVMHVLATSESFQEPITIEQVRDLDYIGKIKRNLLNPPKKDTIVVPNKGFVIVRIIADNSGAWLLECRSCGVSSLPVGIVITVNPQLPEKVKNNLPKCGNFKRPDTLLE